MTRRQILHTLPAASLLAAAGCGRGGGQAPDFSGEDAHRSLVRLSDHIGKVVLVDFWMTTCVPCKTEIPWFVEFAQTYRDRGLVVIGISVGGETWDEVRPFLKERNVDYPVVLGEDAVADAYRVTVLPSTFLLDRQGRIAFSHEGLADKDLFRREIETLL
jgi:cytochrome c biogenesis protein CcmG/thiol:disulfide interchange protein DsbE